jgi:lipopolysaccharide/colanic/teichoic acid biosynthesis glycosyltransferase
MPFVLIVMVLLAVLIRLDSPGSPIFIQERVGFGGRRFKVYKFRTMVCNRNDAQERSYMKEYISGQIKGGDGVLHKPVSKAEITRLGRFLRKASLDELPQIFNVLRGEMSLIGPRPNVPWEVDAYKHWHYERLYALPGITGLAQIMGRSSISFDEIARYDIQYVRQHNFMLDIWIVWKTISIVFSGRGAG